MTPRVSAGIPTGGQFAAKNNAEAEVELAPARPERQVKNNELDRGDVIIGENGGRITVLDYVVTMEPATVSIRTEFGVLSLQRHGTSTLAADDEPLLKRLNVEVDSADGLHRMINQAGYSDGVTGKVFTKADAAEQYAQLLDSGDIAEVEGGFDALWPAIQNSSYWLNLSDTSDDEWSNIREAVEESISSL
tara:strand:+ start:14500 stop:15072 length:573 start_codon:yes stop_codon:yes gene_type:complete